jgi:hypothetical protein
MKQVKTLVRLNQAEIRYPVGHRKATSIDKPSGKPSDYPAESSFDYQRPK